jgi:hypothetical protein
MQDGPIDRADISGSIVRFVIFREFYRSCGGVPAENPGEGQRASSGGWPMIGGFLGRLLARGRPGSSRAARHVHRQPDLDRLEERRLLSLDPNKIVLTATPKFLSPPNGQEVTVTVTGSFNGSDVAHAQAFFHVTDQYGKLEPFGTVVLHPSPTDSKLATFAFQFKLQAERGSMTYNGRQYDILVGAKDKDNTVGKTVAVTVPKEPVHPHGPAAARHGHGHGHAHAHAGKAHA